VSCTVLIGPIFAPNNFTNPIRSFAGDCTFYAKLFNNRLTHCVHKNEAREFFKYNFTLMKFYKIWMTYSWVYSGHNRDFKVTPLLDVEYIKNGTRYRYCWYKMLIRTYTSAIEGCHFEWSWVTMSDLAKDSLTRSIARLILDQMKELFKNVTGVCF